MSNRNKRKFYPLTDAGNAELFAAIYGSLLRYDHRQQRWLIWSERGRRWRQDRVGEICRFAIRAARERLRMAAGIGDLEKRKRVVRWAFQSENQGRISAALDFAKSLDPICDDGEGWNADPWLFGVANGVIDLRAGKVRDERKDDRITMRSPVAFVPGAECPRFQQFLAEIFEGNPELIGYVQRVAGYCLTGSIEEQCLFCFYGHGANGKSTLCGVFQHIFGNYWTNLPFSALEMKNRNTNDLVTLAGARLATASETNEGVRLNEARIKTLTGGDTITARRLYHESFTFPPTYKLLLSFNHKPIIGDDSEGMWRRVRLVPFLRQFKQEEQDKTLPEVLRCEASGILAWAVQGCLQWQRQGLGTPQAVARATEDYREESDHVVEFVEDCCVLGQKEETPIGAMWQTYMSWVERNQEIPLSRKAFNERLERHGCSRARDHRGRRWKGIGLQEVHGPNFGGHVPANEVVQ